MRIISGKYRGRHIPVRKNFPSRPTTDFAKEGLFNILNNNFDFEGLQVLDLFSGTGSISYEFASRGAIVTSVELNYKSYRFIQETASKLELNSIRVIKADTLKFIEKDTADYDIIFADPPYQLKEIAQLPELIMTKGLLKKNGWFILEHSDQTQFAENEFKINRRNYGSVNFSIFSK